MADAARLAAWRDDRGRTLYLFDVRPEPDPAFAGTGLRQVPGGQLLMHFAPLLGIPWADYLEAMREGVRKYGPVRAGIYAMTTGTDEKVAGV